MLKRFATVVIVVSSLTGCATVAISQAEKILNKKIVGNNKLSDFLKFPSSKEETNVLYGGAYLAMGEDEHQFFVPVSQVSELVIDGKKMNLVIDRGIKHTTLSHSSFGVYLEQDDDDNEFYFISVGKLTDEKKMPVSGAVKYLGNAFYRSDTMKDFLNGNSTFIVDFGNKTVNGEIKVANQTIKLLEAKIIDNSFYARQIGKGSVNKERIRGSFFGEGAAELGGVWEKEGQYKYEAATFGAAKQ